MNRPSRLPLRSLAAVGAALLALSAAACAPADEETTSQDRSTEGAGAPATETGDTAGSEGGDCSVDQLDLIEPGTLTVGTDSPAYDPWFQDNDPTNHKGFESAVAYAVAEQLGFSDDQVTWAEVPFNTSFAPGEKDFDFDINQISITPKREEVVDFSDGYYAAAQAVIALKDSPLSEATSIAELADYNLGAQTGTTSLSAIRDVIKPANDPAVFEDTNAAKQALLNGQIDAILADLPTAFYISAVEIEDSTIVGQFQPEVGDTEEFGLLFEKDSELVPCVNEALAALREDGTLDEIEQQWLSDVVDVPELQ